MKRLLMTLSVCTLLVTAAGCSDEVKHVQAEDIASPFATEGDTGLGETGPGEPEVGPTEEPEGETSPKLATLTFLDTHGDDQVPCTGTDHCSISVSFTEARTLSVVYSEDGQPVANQLVQFAISDDPEGIGKLSALSASTDAQGVASIEASAAQSIIGEFEITATVDGDVPPLYFDIIVTPKGQVPLTVLGTYNGNRPEVVSYRAELYLQSPEGQPSCADIEALYDDTPANITGALTNLPQSTKFKELTGLEEAGTQKYTVLAYARDTTDKVVLAWGCDDHEGEVTWGYAKTVEVEMKDRPPLYAGSYAVTTQFDLVSALPDPLEGYVNIVLDIFKSPVGGLLSLACQLGNQVPVLGDMCDLVFNDPANPSSDTLTGTGALVVDILDGVLNAFAKDTIFGDILVGGADISTMLTAFQVDGTIIIAVEPTDDPDDEVDVAYWGEGDLEETWDGVTVKWSLGANCDPLTDENCGTKTFNLTTIQGEAAFANEFTAEVEAFWTLTIDLHPLNVKYGTLINFILEKVAIPLLAGDGSDNTQPVDSYEKLVASMLGGKECLEDPSFVANCCEKFTETVVSGGASTTASIIETMCETLIEAGAGMLSDQLNGLETGTEDTFAIGTLEPCTIFDSDKDMVVDAMGKKNKPCYWDVQLTLFGADTTIDAIWWATRID